MSSDMGIWQDERFEQWIEFGPEESWRNQGNQVKDAAYDWPAVVTKEKVRRHAPLPDAGGLPQDATCLVMTNVPDAIGPWFGVKGGPNTTVCVPPVSW